MSDFLQEDPALVQDFLTESTELLQQLEQAMVELETQTADSEVVHRAFRALHTIKGTSGFLGLGQIVELAHKAEDVLGQVRKGTHPVTPQVIDAVLRSADHLRAMLEDVRSGALREHDIHAVLADLNALLTTPSTDRPLLGELLIVDGAINHRELRESLAEGGKSGRKLGEVLIEKKYVEPAHIDDALERQKAASDKESMRTLRVDAGKIDDLVNLVGELVIERNRLGLVARCSEGETTGGSAVQDCVVRVSFLTQQLQAAVLRTRMVPVATVFRRLPRMVRDLAKALDKRVNLEIEGEETELDKSVVEEIGDPIMHLVRNSLDHGIESPQARIASGKSETGTLRMIAMQVGDHIEIVVSDDGAGIDPERVGTKAVERGMITAERLRAMAPAEVADLVFLPSLSTAAKVSDISGRGVGLDVVKANLKKLGGSVTLENQPGRSCTFRLRLPLTLAMVRVLLVECVGETYGIPLPTVVETARVPASQVHCGTNSDEHYINMRGRVLPLVTVAELFPTRSQPPSTAHPQGSEPIRQDARDGASDMLRVVVVASGAEHFALVVDRMFGQEETVIKPLGNFLRHVPGLAGATISSNGNVVLVLDPPSLSALLQHPPVHEVHAC